MDWLIPLVVGLVAGSGITWLIARRTSTASMDALREQMTQANQNALTFAETQLHKNEESFVKLRLEHEEAKVARERAESDLRNAQKGLEEQKRQIEDIRLQMIDKFKALSSEILRQTLEDAKGDISQKQQAIDSLLKPVADTLKRYEEHITALEKSRQQAYGNIEAQLKQVSQSTQQLQKDTYSLNQALRMPQIKGRWGELTLRRIVELSGMTEHVDFVEQVSVDTEDGRLRPDMIIHIPGGGTLVVDSKVPLNAYLDAMESQAEDERSAHMARHVQLVKTHVRGLSSKSYWNQFEKAPDFVVMFIAGESFFSAALETDRGLMEEAMESRVILASPTTLMAVLVSVARSWRLEQFAENAEEIRRLGADLYERVAKFVENFGGVGRALDQAVTSYDKAVGTLERRVLVSARKFRELGATAQAEIPEVQPVERVPRTVQSDLLVPSANDNDES
jgi:DNA recombination protein RmuC